MDETPPSSTYQALSQFCEEHNSATRLLRVAAQDYAAARCLLLNGLFAGHVLGAQAIEKFLKGYLLFKNPKCPVRKLSHSLPKLLASVGECFPHLQLAGFAPLAEKFMNHYETRYPDNPDASQSMTTADLLELDTFIIFLSENIPCARHVKYQTGIYPFISFSTGYQSTVSPWEYWIKNANQALAPLLPHIKMEYAAVLTELHPSAQH
ncbi:hypothetical protein QEV83_07930 [Methylocapsa sp. D3K7]|uniref:hypothetical protein n=1 Tax=Methylocapsa sp. D3K7 TaxID=3041435 RepID=UPI00244E6399|nr:hypothetical protein [Methylocapsa sp. D3K7]WGJ16161.1 hypothetical protein QEV83_07930 [Methylocapsa sp. D3K7]